MQGIAVVGPQPGFRRAQLQRYLDFLQQGRTERFAYDQSFDSSVAALERDFDRFLDFGASDI